jgi:hypothetical protein
MSLIFPSLVADMITTNYGFSAGWSAECSVEWSIGCRIENHELLSIHSEFQEMAHLGPNWEYYSQNPFVEFFIFHFILPHINI